MRGVFGLRGQRLGGPSQQALVPIGILFPQNSTPMSLAVPYPVFYQAFLIGGGGGGAREDSGSPGGGGGGGALMKSGFGPAGTYVATRGTGGAAQTSSGSTGNDGIAASLLLPTGRLVTAPGGKGGGLPNVGPGGLPVDGDVVRRGGDGGAGLVGANGSPSSHVLGPYGPLGPTAAISAGSVDAGAGMGGGGGGGGFGDYTPVWAGGQGDTAGLGAGGMGRADFTNGGPGQNGLCFVLFFRMIDLG